MVEKRAVLDVEYADADAFARDYRANLHSGGVFVESDATFEARQLVRVRLGLRFANERVELDGEVVHIVPPEMADMGGRPGVAVQFLDDPAALRKRLESFVPVAPASDSPSAVEKASSGNTRSAERRSVRVPVQIESGDGRVIEGHTRNLSSAGVLVGLDGDAVDLSAPVHVTLHHPSAEGELGVDGHVVREVRIDDRVEAVGIQFETDATRRAEVERFVASVQAAEHTRRLGGISGPIAELGPASIVQMLSTTAPRGTVVLRRGEEEGIVCFDGGLLRKVRLGPATGMKALVRILSWREGTFEFHTTLEEFGNEPPIPLEAAILDAVRQIDEGGRLDAAGFPLQARLVAADGDRGAFGSLSKVEAALLDLASAGFTVQRSLEVIPEPDPDIFRALKNLIDGGLLELH